MSSTKKIERLALWSLSFSMNMSPWASEFCVLLNSENYTAPRKAWAWCGLAGVQGCVINWQLKHNFLSPISKVKNAPKAACVWLSRSESKTIVLAFRDKSELWSLTSKGKTASWPEIRSNLWPDRWGNMVFCKHTTITITCGWLLIKLLCQVLKP